ncbi:MAG: rRNA maturation RNase YbeY [Mariprofundaceae bacterium]
MIDIVIDEMHKADSNEVDDPLPAAENIRQAVKAACIEAGFSHEPDLCIRFSDDETVAALNSLWRKKEGVTDIISFPMQEGPDFSPDESLGDMILATPFTIKESARLSIPTADHMLHLIIHGTLHLLGYDHINDDEAEVMHRHEQAAMKKLGLHNPYPDEDEDRNDV